MVPLTFPEQMLRDLVSRTAGPDFDGIRAMDDMLTDSQRHSMVRAAVHHFGDLDATAATVNALSELGLAMRTDRNHAVLTVEGHQVARGLAQLYVAKAAQTALEAQGQA